MDNLIETVLVMIMLAVGGAALAILGLLVFTGTMAGACRIGGLL